MIHASKNSYESIVQGPCRGITHSAQAQNHGRTVAVEDIDGKRTTRQFGGQATAALVSKMTQRFLDVQGDRGTAGTTNRLGSNLSGIFRTSVCQC